jgi:hypothetical protein
MTSGEVLIAEAVADGETSITEITIASDGRIYVFGLSKEVLELLAELCPNSPVLQARMARLPDRTTT